jgi:hypothetical protein
VDVAPTDAQAELQKELRRYLATRSADTALREQLQGQIHSGIGFRWEHAVHLYLKRAKAPRSRSVTPICIGSCSPTASISDRSTHISATDTHIRNGKPAWDHSTDSWRS